MPVAIFGHVTGTWDTDSSDRLTLSGFVRSFRELDSEANVWIAYTCSDINLLCFCARAGGFLSWLVTDIDWLECKCTGEGVRFERGPWS